jgi:hypothetical protein
MGLNLKGLVLALALGGVATAGAQVESGYSQKDYLTIKTMKVSEVSKDILGQNTIRNMYQKELSVQGVPNVYGQVDPTEKVGKVISVARDIVALGEDIYRLVIKGKPTNQTSYAPISVIPRADGKAVDILDTENWRAPVKRTYQVVYENVYGIDVVTFRYSVIYSYGGSYNGKGAYLTAVQIIPESVRTLFGFDFTATMKLGGIQNQGTRENPNAGATLLMEYTVSSIMNAQNVVDSFFVTGKGLFKKL